MSLAWPLGVAFAGGAATILAIELPLLVVPPLRRRLRPGVLVHAFAGLAGVIVTLFLADRSALEGVLGKTALVVGAGLGASLLFSIADVFLLQRPSARGAGPGLPKLVRDVLRVAFVGAGMLVVAVLAEVPVPAVVASSTVLSAVIGLALQDVLKNVFAGMALDLERPFRRGDWLLVDGVPAQVVDITWRSTHLRTRDGVDLYEPNATLAAERVVSYGSGKRPIGVVFEVGLPYSAPPAEVREVLASAARQAPGVLSDPAPQVFLDRYADSALEYRMRVWTTAVAELNRFRDGVNSRIWYALKRRGIEVPFPIRTVQMHSMDAERETDRRAEEHRVLSLLSAVDLFRGLGADALRQLATAANSEHYDAGEVLVREGEVGDSLFVVESGNVEITRSGAEAGTSLLRLGILGPGKFFGEMSLLTGEARSATVTANRPTRVLRLPRTALQPLLAADPSLAEELSRAVVERQAGIAARIADRRDRKQSEIAEEEVASLLGRIRKLFHLS